MLSILATLFLVSLGIMLVVGLFLVFPFFFTILIPVAVVVIAIAFLVSIIAWLFR